MRRFRSRLTRHILLRTVLRMEPREYLPHVEYEARMLMHSARQLSQYPDYDEMTPGSIDKADHDVYLESFLIHARVIHEFFVPRKPSHPDDVRAWQICEDLKISNTKACGHPVLDCEVATRINKQLAHPTMTRVKAKLPFPIREIATEAAI